MDSYTVALFSILKENSVDGLVTAAYPDLMEVTGWSLDTITRVMNGLCRDGKLERVSGGKSRVPSTYRIS